MVKLLNAPVLTTNHHNLILLVGSVGGEGDGNGNAESAASGGREEEVPVDESLFMEQEEDPVNQASGGAAAVTEDEVQVDESLFDIENLGIDDDPSLAQTDAT